MPVKRGMESLLLFLNGVSGVCYILVGTGRASEEDRALRTQYSLVLQFSSWSKALLGIGPCAH